MSAQPSADVRELPLDGLLERIRAIVPLTQVVERHARGESPLSGLDQAEMRLGIAHVVRDCRRIVQHVMEGSGASAHYLDHELQRLNRDVQMMSAHTVFDIDLVAEQTGRALLESDARLFAW